jgi:hypothetical protein
MKVYGFTVQLADPGEITDEFVAAINRAACNDIKVTKRPNYVTVRFDREGVSLADAIGSGIQDVVSAGGKVLRIDVDQTETP